MHTSLNTLSPGYIVSCFLLTTHETPVDMCTARTIHAMYTKSQLTAPSRQKRALRALNMHPLPGRQILPATIILSTGLRHKPKHLRCTVAGLRNVLLPAPRVDLRPNPALLVSTPAPLISGDLHVSVQASLGQLGQKIAVLAVHLTDRHQSM